MQTFLSDWNLEKNAKNLDGKRLFKQLLEGKQILDILVNKKTGSWASHPAVLQWKGYESYLFTYLSFIWKELLFRKIAEQSKLFQQILDLYKKYISNLKNKKCNSDFPEWWNRADILESHRSRLKCKGLIDVQCKAIKKFLKLGNINDWLKQQFGKDKNQLRFVHAEALNKFIKKMGIKIEKNHYDKKEWKKIPFNLEYVWLN